MTTVLTEEQRQLIALNRQKAIERRAARLLENASKAKDMSQGTWHRSTSVLPPATLPSEQSLSKLQQRVTNLHSPFTLLHKKSPLQGICVLISSTRFKVQVGYQKEMISIFRSIPSSVYSASDKMWNFTIENHNRLIAALKQISDSVVVSPLPHYILRTFRNPRTCSYPKMDTTKLEPTLWDALLPFQREGVSFSISRNGRVLIADDMGLGKTIQAIAVAAYYRDQWPLLVITPSSMRYSWKEAFNTWMPSLDSNAIAVLNSSKDANFDSLVTITSYDMLTKKALEIQNKCYKVVIIDESHFLKNPKSARTKAAQKIMKKSKRLVLLSGTPALSRPIELYTQVSAINSKAFPMVSEFGIRYCNGKEMPWGWDYSGSSNMSELQVLLEETVMIRRLKSQVIQQLPAKCRQMIMLDPTKIYRNGKELKNFSKAMSRQDLKGMERRGLLLQYFQETGIAKVGAVCNYIEDVLESKKKFICFAHHRIVLDAICKTLEKKACEYMRIDGTTSSEKRKLLCDQFQFNDTCQVAVLSITAANTGITLTAAQLIVFAELFWNPGILTQAEDRAHRIGQQQSVVVQYLVAQGTADDHIWPLVQKKLDILNKAGLSKDMFDADTIIHRDSCQQTIFEFMADIVNDPELWDQFVEESAEGIPDEPVVKKYRSGGEP